jgi:small-conductance mechanosensitive channel
MFRLRKGFDAPTLVRTSFPLSRSRYCFCLFFRSSFQCQLGRPVHDVAIFGVILGLALQDTLGNFFAGISYKPIDRSRFGDVITVGAQRHTGVVEEITGGQLRSGHFKIILSLLITAPPLRTDRSLSARQSERSLVYFNTLYTDSPAKAIHVVREAVREADNVSSRITPS